MATRSITGILNLERIRCLKSTLPPETCAAQINMRAFRAYAATATRKPYGYCSGIQWVLLTKANLAGYDRRCGELAEPHKRLHRNVQLNVTPREIL